MTGVEDGDRRTLGWSTGEEDGERRDGGLDGERRNLPAPPSRVAREKESRAAWTGVEAVCGGRDSERFRAPDLCIREGDPTQAGEWARNWARIPGPNSRTNQTLELG